MTQRIRKAVFPVAGLGTRFLPATKASPKEMLPVVDKPLIQYAVEEAVEAGVEIMVFITGRNKSSITNHFDTAYELEMELEQRHKTQMLEVVRGIIPSHISCVFIRQHMALGLGHAVLCAQSVIGEEPFAVMLADDLIDNSPGCLKQMVNIFGECGCSILGTEMVAPQDTASYGIVDTGGDESKLAHVKGIVEKPKPDVAPSTRAVVGRYILTPRIFHHLSKTGQGAGGEIQLTDGIAALMEEEQIMAYKFDGKRYDCGNKLGYLQATVDFGLKHESLGGEFRTWLEGRCA